MVTLNTYTHSHIHTFTRPQTQGEQGIRGINGSDGEQGPPGEKGASGRRGPPGKQVIRSTRTGNCEMRICMTLEQHCMVVLE